MILAGGVDRRERVTLGVDIGTNTEIVVSHPGRGTSPRPSCASGPAFEGPTSATGCVPRPGIEAVRLAPEGPRVETIHGAPPSGLCGSGIVDAIAELRRTESWTTGGDFAAMPLACAGQRRASNMSSSPPGRAGPAATSCLPRKDVGEIQLAKGAILAGIQTLLEATGTAPAEVEEVLIAGASAPT